MHGSCKKYTTGSAAKKSLAVEHPTQALKRRGSIFIAPKFRLQAFIPGPKRAQE
jgi:hypothetical protein